MSPKIKIKNNSFLELERKICCCEICSTWVNPEDLVCCCCCCIEQSVIDAAKAAANASSSDIPGWKEAAGAACLLPTGRLGTPCPLGRLESNPCSGRNGPVKKFVIFDWVDWAPPARLSAAAAALSAAAAAARLAPADFPSQLWSLGWRCVRQ